MTQTTNPNCDGAHCCETTGPVRLYPLGGGANLILCQACFSHENAYRDQRARETQEPHKWPRVAWATAEEYPQP